LSVYFDASLIVSMLLPDALSVRADAYIRKEAPTPIVSDFAAAEVASVVGAKLRRGALDVAGARRALDEFDTWRTTVATQSSLAADDVAVADGFLRRLDLTLRAPDALHLAIARRLGSPLATFDVRMTDAARALGLQLAPT
jgi:predicted nucleic acid-binding protein